MYNILKQFKCKRTLLGLFLYISCIIYRLSLTFNPINNQLVSNILSLTDE